MSDAPEDDAFKLFQKLETAAKALDKTAGTLTGVVAGEVIATLHAAKSATADAARQLAATNTASVNLSQAMTDAKQMIEAAKEAIAAVPNQQSWDRFIGMLLGIALFAGGLFGLESIWPSSTRQGIENAVLMRIAATAETCQNAHAVLGTSWFWVTNRDGQKIAACGFAIVNQPPAPAEPEPTSAPPNPRRK